MIQGIHCWANRRRLMWPPPADLFCVPGETRLPANVCVCVWQWQAHPLKSGLLGHGVVCILWRADPMDSGEKGTVMAKWRFVTVPTPTAQKPGRGRRLHLFLPALNLEKKTKNTTHWQNQWNPLLCNHGTISNSRSEYRQAGCDTLFFSLWPL